MFSQVICRALLLWPLLAVAVAAPAFAGTMDIPLGEPDICHAGRISAKPQ